MIKQKTRSQSLLFVLALILSKMGIINPQLLKQVRGVAIVIILDRMMVIRGISNTQPKMMNMVKQRLT